MGGGDPRRRPGRPGPRRDAVRGRRLADQGAPGDELRRATQPADRAVDARPASRPHLLRHGGGLRRHQRPLGPARLRPWGGGRNPGLPHGARTADRRVRRGVLADQPGQPAGRPDLGVRQPAPAASRPQLAGNLPQRDRHRRLRVRPGQRRIPAVPRPHVARQGRPPCGGARPPVGHADEARRQDARRRRARSLRGGGATATWAATSSTSARSATTRRSSCSSGRPPRSSRSSGRSRSAW